MSVSWCTGYIYLLGRLDWRGKSVVEPIRSSETSAIKTQTPGNYPKRNILLISCTLREDLSTSYCCRRHLIAINSVLCPWQPSRERQYANTPQGYDRRTIPTASRSQGISFRHLTRHLSGTGSPLHRYYPTNFLPLFTYLCTLKDICVKRLLSSLPTSYRCKTGGSCGRGPFKFRPITAHEDPEGE